VTFSKLAGQDAISVRLIAANDAQITNGASINMTITAGTGGICPQAVAAQISQQALTGGCQQIVTLLRVDPKPGNTDPSFGSDFSSLKVAAKTMTAADGSAFAMGSDNFSFKIGVFKFNTQGALDSSFGNNSGTNNGLRLIDGLSSAVVKFEPLRIFPLSNAAQVRLVGELVATGGTATGLAVVDSTPFPIVKTFDPGGIPIDSDARLIGDHTVISGTLQGSVNPIDKCFLYVLNAQNDLGVHRDYRFNPLSTSNSHCAALTDAPGGDRFFVGGNQQGLVITPVVAKFKLDGEFDKSFAGDGIAKLEGLGSVNLVRTLLVQPNGKILAGLGSEGTVVRLLSDGKYDNSFAGNGIIRLKPGGNVSIKKLVLGAGGNIFALLENNSIAKLNSSGVLQTDFGNNGFVTGSGAVDINVVSSGNLPTVQVLKGSEFRRIFQ
jgi:Domain of unknown function (DUF5122) beta-propeller